MADLARVTGKCGLVTSQTVISKQEATKGQEFTFHTAAVIVADTGVSNVRFDPTRDGRTFKHGDVIDVLVEVSSYGSRTQLNYVADYPESLKTQEAEAVLASA